MEWKEKSTPKNESKRRWKKNLIYDLSIYYYPQHTVGNSPIVKLKATVDIKNVGHTIKEIQQLNRPACLLVYTLWMEPLIDNDDDDNDDDEKKRNPSIS